MGTLPDGRGSNGDGEGGEADFLTGAVLTGNHVPSYERILNVRRPYGWWNAKRPNIGMRMSEQMNAVTPV